MPTNKKHKRTPRYAIRAAKRWICPLAGDYLQECQVRELARIIEEEVEKSVNDRIEEALAALKETK